MFLILLVLGREPSRKEPVTKKRKAPKPKGLSTARIVIAGLAAVAMAGIVVQTGEASCGDVSKLAEFSDSLKAGQAQVVRTLSWTDPSQYEPQCMTYPWMDKVVPRAKIMAKRHWGMFRHGVPNAADLPLSTSQ